MESKRKTRQRQHEQRKEDELFGEWTWEDVLDGKGCYTWEEILAGRDRLPWEQVEALRRAEAAGDRSRRYEGTRLARKPESQPQTFLGGGGSGRVWQSQGSDLSQHPLFIVRSSDHRTSGLGRRYWTEKDPGHSLVNIDTQKKNWRRRKRRGAGMKRQHGDADGSPRVSPKNVDRKSTRLNSSHRN